MAYIISDTNATVFVGGKQYSADSSHPNWSQIVKAIKDAMIDKVPDLINIARSLTKYCNGVITVDEDACALLYKGEEIHSTLVERIMQMKREGFNINPMINFLANLMDNPSKRAVDELYSFLEVGQLPITADGHFLAYKRVRPDFKDIHSAKFDNSIGKVLEMPRNNVDEDKNRTCSAGLHFCSLKYLPNFGSSSRNGDHIMIVKINPRDVVAIPADYNDTKGRTCRYEVVGEYTDVNLDDIQSAFTSSVDTSFGDEDVYALTDEQLEALDRACEAAYAAGYDDAINGREYNEVAGDNGDTGDSYDEGFDDGEYALANGTSPTTATTSPSTTSSLPDPAFVSGYMAGYSDGRGKAPRNVSQESGSYVDGYAEGFDDGKGHKAKQFK